MHECFKNLDAQKEVLVVSNWFTHYAAVNKSLPLDVFLTGSYIKFQHLDACTYLIHAQIDFFKISNQGCNSRCALGRHKLFVLARIVRSML